MPSFVTEWTWNHGQWGLKTSTEAVHKTGRTPTCRQVKNCRRTPKQSLQNVPNAMGWVIQMSWQYQRQCCLSPCSLDLKSLPIRMPLHITKCSGVWDSVSVCVLVAQSCLTLCDPMDYRPPGFSVHGILQTRIQKWVAFPSPEDLPYPGIEPRSPALQADSSLSEPPAILGFSIG